MAALPSLRVLRNQYVYEPLPGSSSIRVLELEPGPKESPLRGALKITNSKGYSKHRGTIHWNALSYCWENSATTEFIILDGKRLRITKSLHLALQYLRAGHQDGDVRNWWIDQICVNQADLGERGHQVGMMPYIYGEAIEVIAWLGQDPPFAQELFDFAQYHLLIRSNTKTLAVVSNYELFKRSLSSWTDSGRHQLPNLDGGNQEREIHTAKYIGFAYSELLRRPWFGRVWTVQEAILAKKLTIQCGSYTTPWAAFIYLSNLHHFLRHQFWPVAAYSAMLNNNYIHRVRRVIPARNVKLLDLLLLFWDRKSSDPRDKVYGLISLSWRDGRSVPLTVPLHADYFKSVNEVFTDSTLYCLQGEGNLDILGLCCAGNLLPQPTQVAVADNSARPSWEIDWTEKQPSCIQLYNHRTIVLMRLSKHTARLYHTSLATFARPQLMKNKVLVLQGLLLDEVQSISNSFHETIDQYDPTSAGWIAWRDFAKSTYKLRNVDKLEAYLDDFWRCICRDAITPLEGGIRRRATSADRKFFDAWSACANLRRSPNTFTDDFCAKYEFSSFMYSLDVANRRLLRTSRGYLGLACEHVQVGDKVCVL
jgi:hypothetical protein